MNCKFRSSLHNLNMLLFKNSNQIHMYIHKKTKLSFLSLLGLVFIAGAVPTTVYLIQQNQEIREKAEEITVDSITVCNLNQYPDDCFGIDARYQWGTTNLIAIQNAIDDVDAGGEVILKNGIYEVSQAIKFPEIKNGVIERNFYAHLVLTKGITLKGENGNGSTIINGNWEVPDDGEVNFGVTIYSDGAKEFTIRDLRIEGTKLTFGIGVFQDSAGKILNNRIMDVGYSGILIKQNSDLIVKNNVLSGSWTEGIEIEDGKTIEIINNTINNCGIGDTERTGGISIYKGLTINIINNIITNNKDKGIFLDVHTFTGSLINDYNDVFSNNEGDYVNLIPGENSISIFPEFSDDYYHLQPTSPAVDTGDPSICDLDYTRSDMGAYGGGIDCGTNLQIKFKLEKKEKNGTTYYARDKVRVKLIKVGTNEAINIFTTADDSGVTPYNKLGNLADGDYEIFVKPDEYISKKRILNLTNGDQILDFSDTEFRAGDISQSSYDFLNSLDFSKFIVCFRKPDDPANMKLGDLNIDGALNSVDYSIMIKTYRENGKGELVGDPK